MLAGSCSTIPVLKMKNCNASMRAGAQMSISRCATPLNPGIRPNSMKTWAQQNRTKTGGHGDLIKGLFEGAELFVYDISGATPLQGVTPTKEPASCKADLIVNSNVLEHVGFPRVLVGQILEAAPKGGLVLVEVPCEFAMGFSRIARRIAQVGLMSLRRPSRAPQLFRPAALYMMHEHINYFTENSLTTLMRSCGSTVIASGAYPYSGTAGTADMAWCLAQKSA